MTEQVHERARRLLDAWAVEGITAAERAWLEAHLEGCPDCAARHKAIEQTVALLRAVPVDLPATVVERTRRQMRMRARELREHEARMRALWFSCALAWLIGVASAPLMWRGLDWLVQHGALPAPVQLLAFLLWWTVPGVVVAGVLTWHRSRASAEEERADLAYH